MKTKTQLVIAIASIMLFSATFIYTYFFDQGDWIDCSIRNGYYQSQAFSCGFNLNYY
jgi:hypothetical protein